MPKITISPAQALLKLIAHYRTHASTPEEQGYLENLIHIYLDGTVNPDLRNHYYNFVSFHANDVLEPYIISTDPVVIDSDPTRRYFETLLSLESIKGTIQLLPQDRLNYFYTELCNMLRDQDYPSYTEAMQVLAGQVPNQKNELFKEYASYIKRISNGKVFGDDQGFTSDDREVLHQMVSCTFLSVKCAQSIAVNASFPLNVYGSNTECFGYFGGQRGKKLKDKAQNKGLSHNYGLIKGHMPVSISDDAYSTDCFPFLKSSEQANYEPNTNWVDNNFYHLVHPFSNSISGTMLCLLRSLCFFQNSNIFIFTDNADDFKNFIRLATSSIVYYSGGHSLHEILSVLRLPEVIREVQEKHRLNHLHLEKAFTSQLYLDENRADFDRALNKSIAYNEQYLQRCQINSQIETGVLLQETEKHETNEVVVIEQTPHYDIPQEHTALNAYSLFALVDSTLEVEGSISKNRNTYAGKRKHNQVNGVDESEPKPCKKKRRLGNQVDEEISGVLPSLSQN